ncbi:MAG: hypothetical protein HY763_00730 [Planctomycetes bacterium]|nr:hypothetical protein [Planctomycetota bacterium]
MTALALVRFSEPPRIRRGSRAACVSLSLGLVAGCYSTGAKKEPVWTPKPKVAWTDLTPQAVTPVSNDYRVLASGATRGLFPAAMGVTRVAVVEPGDTLSTPGAGKAQLHRDPRNEFLQWNRAFDDQMAVSEVYPISQRDLGGAEADPRQIIAAVRALHAKLGLVYAVNELGPTETEMLGVIFDTAAGVPLAVVHAQAESVIPPENEPRKKPVDAWKSDSRALVRAKFERLAYAAIRELILNDEPADVEPPTGWTPAGPIRPVEWPPRRFSEEVNPYAP